MAATLGVSDPAREKLKNLNATASKRAQALKAEADQTRLELSEALAKDLPDQDHMAQHTQHVDTLASYLGELWTKAEEHLSKLLSPEQRERLKRWLQGDLRPATHAAR